MNDDDAHRGHHDWLNNCLIFLTCCPALFAVVPLLASIASMDPRLLTDFNTYWVLNLKFAGPRARSPLAGTGFDFFCRSLQ